MYRQDHRSETKTRNRQNGVTKPLEANYNESNTDVFPLLNTVQEQATAKETSADPV